MLTLLVVSAALAQQPDAGAQPQGRALDAVPGFEPGKTYTLNITRAREQPGRQRAEISFPVTVRLTESKGDGYALAVDQARAFDDPELDGIFQMAGVDKAEIPTTFIAEFNDRMQYTGLENRDEVVARVGALMDGLAAGLREAIPGEQTERTIAGLRGVFNAETIERAAISNITGYTDGYGWTLAPGESESMPLGMPSPFGGPPLPGKLVATNTDDPATPDTIEYRTEHTIDEEGVEDYFAEFAKIANLSDEEIENFKSNFWALKIEDTTTYAYDTSSKLVTEAVFRRFIVPGPGREESTEIYEWRLER